MRLANVIAIGLAVGVIIRANPTCSSVANLSNVGAESSRSLFKFPQIPNFTNFKQKFHKHYKSIAEELSRRRIFLSRVFRVFVSNVKYKHSLASSYLSISSRSDLTQAETNNLFLDGRETLLFEERMQIPLVRAVDLERALGPKVSGVRRLKRHISEEESASLNSTLHHDLRKTGCLSEPRDQGSCASCYAFATIALYEWLHCMQTGSLAAYSEQFLIDCGHLEQMNACRGGHPIQVAQFVARHGLRSLASYKYIMRPSQCPLEDLSKLADREPERDSRPTRVEESGLVKIRTAEFDRVLRFMPILVGLRPGAAFVDYGGGVDDGSNCDEENAHAILLVGSGTEDGIGFWLLRNSFGPQWGEGGHYRLAKEAMGACAVSQFGFLSRAKFSS